MHNPVHIYPFLLLPQKSNYLILFIAITTVITALSVSFNNMYSIDKTITEKVLSSMQLSRMRTTAVPLFLLHKSYKPSQ